MSQFIMPLIFIIASIGAFMGVIDPTYKETQTLASRLEEIDAALYNSQEIRRIRDELLNRYNSLTPLERDRITKLLPDTVDNIQLIMEIDNIASVHDMAVSDVVVRELADAKEPEIGVVHLSFSVNGSYDELVSFLKDLERSLHIVELNTLRFSSEGEEYTYNISVETYWLKNL
ncbi:type 4a pilus biogenesis protein PilO [bacterium]|nr:type 4a pilus biogenesis protein PilO [bacterium]MCI0679953.1 type 4a pilus biogenesis protein PilO [bacterium]